MGTPNLNLLELLERLVSFDTVSKNSNLELIHFSAQFLSDLGGKVCLYHDQSRRKANLVARFGPEEPGGLMLSGHSDVVPVDGQAWNSNPFQLTEKDQGLYGRGTADMKSFLALSMELAGKLRSESLRLPLWLCFTYDEEVGCLGILDLLDALEKERTPLPAWALVGEPTDLRVCTMHKGMGQMTVQIRGVEGHSSRPDLGVNAIDAAARLLVDLEQIRRDLQRNRRHEDLLALPFSTFSIGWMRGGGDVVNIIPNCCSFSSDFRLVPGAEPDEVIAAVERAVAELDEELRRRDSRASATFEVNRDYPPLELPVDGPLASLLRRSVPDPRPIALNFSTEAAALAKAGVEAVVCGPGSILQAHRPNESISLKALHQAQVWLDDVVRSICIDGGNVIS